LIRIEPARHIRPIVAFTFIPSMSLFVDCESEAELEEAFSRRFGCDQLKTPG
jgi:hypothetical protein